MIARKKHTVSFLHHPIIDSGEKVARNATQGRNEAQGSSSKRHCL
jgi:hypothetical protein